MSAIDQAREAVGQSKPTPALLVDAMRLVMGGDIGSLLGMVERGVSLADLSLMMPGCEVEALVADQRERQTRAGFFLIAIGKAALAQAAAPPLGENDE